MQLYEGAWCRLRSGRVAGPALPIVSGTGHSWLVGGLYYLGNGMCQAGRPYDVLSIGDRPEDVKDENNVGTQVFALAGLSDGASAIPAMMASDDAATMSTPGGVNIVAGEPETATIDNSAPGEHGAHTLTIGVSTSFGALLGTASKQPDGTLFISDACLQIANDEPIPVSDRALDRCAIMRGDDWQSFRAILETAANEEIAA